MELGIVFPQNEIGTDPDHIAAYGSGVDNLGYGYLLAAEHVLGASSDRPNWDGPYDHTVAFHEPFALFSYLAGETDDVRFVTSVLVLPQRRTALVAKQAAELDVLSEGRLDLGVGVGWNRVEYEALGADFGTRGERIEEQIEVLRALWENELVTYEGKYHRISKAGLNPRPVQRPIPLWIGGQADPVLERTARMADGWVAQTAPFDRQRERIEFLNDQLRRHGRDPAEFPVLLRVYRGPNERRPDAAETPEEWIDVAERASDVGVTHIAFDTRDSGLETYREHLDAAERFVEAMGTTGVVDV